ncbi:AGE family epimerase/isomerase [uncultured Fibrella sp.]|uniref:AGE family epimerase/isomerase n=1 Tax=uncultured Fibrella sp. TaxID=1284596 RepID=UPI0035CA0321
MTIPDLRLWQRELSQELKDILAYWQRYAPDPTNGGFYGTVGSDNVPRPGDAKGVVLNSRILWTFSAAARHTQHTDEYLPVAKRAFDYLATYFRDPQYGGVYWMVDAKGQSIDDSKQLYGQAFAVYGLSEYYHATKHKPALEFAQAIYRNMVEHAYDPAKGGFIEAFARDWTEAKSYAIARKDNGESKTMNTHLHILEAFVGLLRVWPDSGLKTQVRGLIHIFLDHIIDPKTHRMVLFQGTNWEPRRTGISYGHDIEASWLLLEAAKVLHESDLLAKVRQESVLMARAALSGLDPDGGMNYEYEGPDESKPMQSHDGGRWNRERSWWVMAEAMVGFMNAYQLTKDKLFLDKSAASWDFTKTHLLDTKDGEWFSGVDQTGKVLGNTKISAWKCPYHNGRACMETMERIGKLIDR